MYNFVSFVDRLFFKTFEGGEEILELGSIVVLVLCLTLVGIKHIYIAY
jgi:hypothetical protein